MSDDVLVTGGLGFIGAAFVRRLAASGANVVNVDADTYAGDRARLGGLDVETHILDVRDPAAAELIGRVRPEVVVHFAAETHVTRSETDEDSFFSANVEGTRYVLEAARSAGVPTFVHVSTNEVYGPALEQPFKETDKVPGEGLATSAYARSKAVADDLAQSYSAHMRMLIVRPTNCFGPWQHPEKAIARWATRALRGERLPVWGDGAQIRDWMYVDDVCSAIELLVEAAPDGVYNAGPGGDAMPNLEIARLVAGAAGRGDASVYLTAYDRPGHDRRYSVDSTKLRDLGWAPEVGVVEGIKRTVAWFSAHRAWWAHLVGPAEALYRDAQSR